MQSFLTFTAEFQAAKRRLLNNLEASDDGRLSVESDEDAREGGAQKPANFPQIHRCMKVQKLLRTEWYRTCSVPTKTESVSSNIPRVRRRSFLSRLGRIRDWRSAGNGQKRS